MIHSSWSLLHGLAASEAVRPCRLWSPSLLSYLRTDKLPVNMTISNSISLRCWKEAFRVFKLSCPRMWRNAGDLHGRCLTADFCGVFFSSSSTRLRRPCLRCGALVSKPSSAHKGPMHPALAWRWIKPRIVLSPLKSAGADRAVRGAEDFFNGSGFGQRGSRKQAWGRGSPCEALGGTRCRGEQGGHYFIKAGPGRAKVALRDFREEVVSPEKPACGNEPREAEYTIREDAMKKATEWRNFEAVRLLVWKCPL